MKRQVPGHSPTAAQVRPHTSVSYSSEVVDTRQAPGAVKWTKALLLMGCRAELLAATAIEVMSAFSHGPGLPLSHKAVSKQVDPGQAMDDPTRPTSNRQQAMATSAINSQHSPTPAVFSVAQLLQEVLAALVVVNTSSSPLGLQRLDLHMASHRTDAAVAGNLAEQHCCCRTSERPRGPHKLH